MSKMTSAKEGQPPSTDLKSRLDTYMPSRLMHFAICSTNGMLQFTVCNLHCANCIIEIAWSYWIVQLGLCVYCIVQIEFSKLYYPIYSLQYAICNLQFPLHDLHSAIWISHFALCTFICNFQWTVCIAQLTLISIMQFELCKLYCVYCILQIVLLWKNS